MKEEDFEKLKDILGAIDSNSLKTFLEIKMKDEGCDAFKIFSVMSNYKNDLKYGLLPLSDIFIEVYLENKDKLDKKIEAKFSERIKKDSKTIEENSERINEIAKKNSELRNENDELKKNCEDLDKLIKDQEALETELTINNERLKASKEDLKKIDDNIKRLKEIVNSECTVPSDIPPELIGTNNEGIMKKYKEMLGACYIETKAFPNEFRTGDLTQNSKNILYEFILLKNFLEDNGKCFVSSAELDGINGDYEKIMEKMESASNEAKKFFSQFINKMEEE